MKIVQHTPHSRLLWQEYELTPTDDTGTIHRYIIEQQPDFQLVRCDECNRDVDALIEFYEDESQICLDCLKKAIAMLKATVQKV